MNFFETLDVPNHVKEALKSQSITKPTEVQANAIPPAIEGSDILATSQTGTGKTLSFLLPLFHHLDKDKKAGALILAPTRELALQIQTVASGLVKDYPVSLIIGGDEMRKQLNSLRKRPRIIIATPGRLIDHIKRGTVALGSFSFLVLDETDRMLDMGFVAAINNIMAYLPKERQTMMFSATMPESINKLAQTYLKNPARITVGSAHEAHELIEQNHIKVGLKEKFPTLIKELEKVREDTVLIFVKTKRNTDTLAKKLKATGYEAASLNGDLSQSRRKQVLEFFRNGKVQILVATDIAARGIDIDHIRHVINYDIPFTPEEYIHRVGRTGRAGSTGRSISFVSPEDTKKWKAVCNMLAGKEYKGSERRSSRVVKKIDAFLAATPVVVDTLALEKNAVNRARVTPASHKKVIARKEFDFAMDATLTDEQGAKKPHNKYAQFSKKKKEDDDMKDELFERVLKDKNVSRPSAPKEQKGAQKEIKADGRPEANPFERFKNKNERRADRNFSEERREKAHFAHKRFDSKDRAHKPFDRNESFRFKKDRPFGNKHSEGTKRSEWGREGMSVDRNDFRKDSKPFGERKSFGDRKPFGKKEFGDKKDFRSFNRDRKPFGENREFGERKSFGDRKPFARDDKRPFGKKSFSGKRDFKDGGFKKEGFNKDFKKGGFKKDFKKGGFKSFKGKTNQFKVTQKRKFDR